MTSKIMRDNPLFMRNNFEATGKWGLPLIQKQSLPTDNIALVACSDTRNNDNKENKQKGVHFFVDDYRFGNVKKSTVGKSPKTVRCRKTIHSERSGA